MALHRATQSAIWYYISCTPCAEARYRKKLRDNAERWKVERDTMAAADPNMYRHPSPSGTNPHWQTEMDAGPHLVSRGRKKTNTSDTRRPRTSMTLQSNSSQQPSSLDLSLSAGSRDGRNDSKFDFKQYQREDEMLWGSTTTDSSNPNELYHHSGVTRPAKARVRGGDVETSYVNYRNPQVNDLHPATVTKLNSREEARWMFQGPPNADVMKGRVQARGSRSDSATSSRPSVKSPVLLSRDASQRDIGSQLKIEEGSFNSTRSRGSSFRTPNDMTIPLHDKTMMAQQDFAVVDEVQVHRERPRKSSFPTRGSEQSEESALTVVRSPDSAPEPLQRQQSRRLATTPQLSTIVSDNISPSDSDSIQPSERPKENNHPGQHHTDNSIFDRDRNSRRSASLTRDESLKVLQDLAPSSAIFNTTIVSSDDLVRASKKKPRGPSQPSIDRRPSDFDTEIFEPWDEVEFELPEWIHEHTKREVKERWSMDI